MTGVNGCSLELIALGLGKERDLVEEVEDRRKGVPSGIKISINIRDKQWDLETYLAQLAHPRYYIHHDDLVFGLLPGCGALVAKLSKSRTELLPIGHSPTRVQMIPLTCTWVKAE